MEKSDGKMKNPSLHRMKKELDEGRDGFWIMAGGVGICIIVFTNSRVNLVE